MQKNYIIIAHKTPNQVLQLVNSLDDGCSSFYIHINIEIDIRPFLNVFTSKQQVQFIAPREKSTWADVGVVKATLNGMKQICREGKNGYCILMSGQDFPIKSNAHSTAFLQKNYGKEFIETFKIPTDNWFEKGVNRIEHYKFNLSTKRGDFVVVPSIYNRAFYTLKTGKAVVKLLLAGKIKVLRMLLKKRTFPNYLEPHGGGQWWCLTTTLIEKILTFVDENPDYLHYHTYSLIPDELFFQSIVHYLLNGETDLLMDSVTFVDWERKNSVGAPTFTLSDFELLQSQPENKLFARKFDVTFDAEILKKVAEFIS